MKNESLSILIPKLILAASLIVGIGVLLGIMGFVLSDRPKTINPPQMPAINKIEISSDTKSILNADTKEIVFTIADTQKYLEDSGYFYNPDTFQTTNAKYEGDCFGDAALSNNKDRVIFSSGCLPGDLPQAWVGVYTLPKFVYSSLLCPVKNVWCQVSSPRINFLIGGSGRNFVWSSDDKTIAYEADLGLSGMTETRTIDSNTGEILETRSKSEIDTSDWKTYRNEKYGFEVKYPHRYAISRPLATDTDRILQFEFNSQKIGLINIESKEKHQSKSILDFAKDNPTPKDKIGTKKEILKQIAGLNAVEQNVTFIEQDESVKDSTWYYFENLDYYIVFVFYKTTDTDVQKVFNQILSTFKFID